MDEKYTPSPEISPNVHTQLVLTARERVDRALGGRFRDGVECPPYVLTLFQLAEDDARREMKLSRQPTNLEEIEPDQVAVLRAHLEVCPVCRHTYQAVFEAARRAALSELAGDAPAGSEANAASEENDEAWIDDLLGSSGASDLDETPAPTNPSRTEPEG